MNGAWVEWGWFFGTHDINEIPVPKAFLQQLLEFLQTTTYQLKI